MLFQLAFDQGERELRTVNRNVQFGKNPGKPANVILMTMGEQNGANFVTILEQVGDVGNDNVYAE